MDDDFTRPSFPDLLVLHQNKRPTDTLEKLPYSSAHKKKPKITSNPFTSLSTHTPASCSFSNLWVDEFAPKSSKNLVINKKKVNQLREWLTFGYKTQPLLALTGPSGSGKSITLTLLADELALDIVEWFDPVRYEGSEQDSITQQFLDFLIKGTKYAGPNHVLLVKHFPLCTWEMLRTIQACLPQLSNRTHAFRLVFIFSEYTLPPDLLEESSSNIVPLLSPTKLIPPVCLPKCCILSFNPVASTFLKKALQLISSHVSPLSSSLTTSMQAMMDPIVSHTQGDLKHAIHLFQLNCVLPHFPLHLDTKDAMRSLFPELGHMLYNKRDTSFFCSTQPLPSHLQKWYRPHPIADYHSYLARIPVSSSTFAMYLHANVYPFFPCLSSYAFLTHQFAEADRLSRFPFVLPIYVLSTALAHGVEELSDMDFSTFFMDDPTPTPTPPAPLRPPSSTPRTFHQMHAPVYLFQKQKEHREHLRRHRLRCTEVNFSLPSKFPTVPLQETVYSELDDDPIELDIDAWT